MKTCINISIPEQLQPCSGHIIVFLSCAVMLLVQNRETQAVENDRVPFVVCRLEWVDMKLVVKIRGVVNKFLN